MVALSDASGDTVQVYEYDVYGQVAASDPNHTNPFLFTGRRFDTETGLYYYRARYYNASIGRFLQTDPVGYEAGMNLYRYCLNNPLNLRDPKGLYPKGDAPDTTGYTTSDDAAMAAAAYIYGFYEHMPSYKEKGYEVFFWIYRYEIDERGTYEYGFVTLLSPVPGKVTTETMERAASKVLVAGEVVGMGHSHPWTDDFQGEDESTMKTWAEYFVSEHNPTFTAYLLTVDGRLKAKGRIKGGRIKGVRYFFWVFLGGGGWIGGRGAGR